MRPPRSTSPESVALALQSVQVLVEAVLGSLATDHHVVGAVVAESDDFGLGTGHVVHSVEALEVRKDSGLGLLVAEVLTDLGAVEDLVECRVDGGEDVVDGRHRWQRVWLVKCEVVEGDVGRSGVPDDGGVVADRSELAEDLHLIAAGIEWGEVLGRGGNGHEDLLGLDETLALGGIDEDLDAAVDLAHACGLADPGGKEYRVGGKQLGSECLEEHAVVHHRAGLEALHSLQETERHGADLLDGRKLEDVTKGGGETEDGLHCICDVVLLDELAERHVEVLGDGVGEVEATLKLRVLCEDGAVLRQSNSQGGLVGRREALQHLTSPEVNLLGWAGRERACWAQSEVEACEPLVHQRFVMVQLDSHVDGESSLEVHVGFGVTSKAVRALNNHDPLSHVLELDGRVSTHTSTSDNDNISVNNLLRVVVPGLHLGRPGRCHSERKGDHRRGGD